MVKFKRVIRCLNVDQSEESTFAAPVKNTVSKSTVDLRGHIGTPIVDGDSRTMCLRVELQGGWAGKVFVGVNQNIRRAVVRAAGGWCVGRSGVVSNHGYTDEQSHGRVMTT